MRTIERSSAFKRNYKRTLANPRYRRDVDVFLEMVLTSLVADQPLSLEFRDHGLIGLGGISRVSSEARFAVDLSEGNSRG